MVDEDELIKLFVVSVDKYLHTMCGVVFMRHNMDRIAAITAVFEVILIITADIQSDVGWVAAKGAKDGFVKELHDSLLLNAASKAV